MVKAIIETPSRIATRLGIFAALVNAVAPKAYEVVMNTAFELFPDSAAAKGDKKALKGETQPSSEQIAFAVADARGALVEPRGDPQEADQRMRLLAAISRGRFRG